MTEEEITARARTMGLDLQLAGVSESDAWKILCRALGLFTGVISPDAAALERNLDRTQQNVEAAARAVFGRKLEVQGRRKVG